MTSRCRTIRSSAVPVARDGATLTEVLISILVMSVGILSVMAMFPISILRSIQATQLTNAAILRENAEHMIRARPQLVRPPSFTSAPGWDGDIADEWKPDTSYAVNDIVVPSVKQGSPLPSPPMRYVCTVPGTSGAKEPNFALTGTTVENANSGNAPQWQPVPVNYVVDPLGSHIHAPADKSMFGSLPRVHAGLALRDARQIMSLGDSFVTAVEELPLSITGPSGSPANTITFPPTTDLSNIDTTFRVVVYTLDGKKSAVRNLDNAPTGPQVEMDAALPADILNDISTNGPGYVRIEAPLARYSWMLTLRHEAGMPRPEVYCVVFFNRSFSILDEAEYEAGYDDDGADLPAPIVVDLSTGPDDPLIRPGNFLFDSQNAIWYRMQTVEIDGNEARITPERLPSEDISDGKAMFLPGIIDVFPVDL